MVKLGYPRRSPSELITRSHRVSQTRSTGPRVIDKTRPILTNKSAAARPPAARPDNKPKRGSRNWYSKIHRSIHSKLPMHNYAMDHHTISNHANTSSVSTYQKSSLLFGTQTRQPFDTCSGNKRQ
jgi:hypothetical protein